jgi:hypothetical protein
MALSWQSVEAVRIPTNEQHLVLQAFAEDTLGVNIVKLREHTPMDELTVALYWQNLSPGAQTYTYCMQFGIRPDLSCKVIFGKYDPKGSGTPFDGKLVRLDSAADPFEGAVKRLLSKSRSDSWVSKLSKKSRSDSWISKFSKKSKSTSWGSTDRRRENSRHPPNLKKKLVSPPAASSLDQKDSVVAKNTLEPTSGFNIGTDGFMTPYTGMTSSGTIENDGWIQLGLERALEAQDSTKDSDDRNGQAAAEGTNAPNHLQSEDIEGTSGQLNSTEYHDFGLRKRGDVPPHSKDYPAGPTKMGVATSLCLTTVRSKPSRDKEMLGDDWKYSLLPHKEGQNELLSDNFMPAALNLPKHKAWSMGSRYSRSSSACHAPPSGSSGDEERPHSSSKSKQTGQRVLVPDPGMLGVEGEEIHGSEDEIPIVSEILSPFPNRSLGPQPDTSMTAEQPSGHGKTISEPSSTPLDERPIEVKNSSEHSSTKPSSRRKKRTSKRRKPADLISPKRIIRSASDNVELTPAPNADEHWTWDDDVNAYFHVDSDTQSIIWLEDSGSEDNARP